MFTIKWVAERTTIGVGEVSFHGAFAECFGAVRQSGPGVVIVSSDTAVTIVGGAQVRPGDLTTVLSRAPTLVVADGGADTVLEAGLYPAAVIGDMDSLSPAAATAFAGTLYRIDEQETTDFDKALRHVNAPLVLALGVTGGRIDHELAAFNVLVRHADRPCIAVGAESVVFHCPKRIELHLPPGSPLSLFPMAPVRAVSQGLRWPTDGLDLAPAGRIGTSNEVTGPVVLRPDRRGLLVILPRPALDAAITALLPVGVSGPPPSLAR